MYDTSSHQKSVLGANLEEGLFFSRKSYVKAIGRNMFVAGIILCMAIIDEPEKTISRSKLSQLTTGLLMLICRQEMAEPSNAVIDRMSFEYDVVQRRRSYSTDIERVLSELKLTAELIAEINERKLTKGNRFEPEEIINYYGGIFFNHVHQLKDKLFKLVDLMIADKPFTEPYKERDIKIARFLQLNKDLLEKIGIDELLKSWQQEDDAPIGVVLKKRTGHHHRLSRLPLNADFQNLKLSKLMLSPESIGYLTDYGKQEMARLGKESFKKLKEDTVVKQQNTIQEIEKNLEAIAEKLITYYKVPTAPEELEKIGKAYSDFLNSLRITNEANANKIPGPLKSMLAEMVEQIKRHLDRHIVSVYLVGSCGRGEFIPGVSDINLYIITNDYSEVSEQEYPVAFTLLSEDDFLSERHKKDRFICWSDGILLWGKEFEISGQNFPKPGALLCLLLNRGVIERLEKLKTNIETLSNPIESQLRAYTVKTVKMMIDYLFGVAMTNKPLYTASRKKKIAHIKEAFPKNRYTLVLEQLYNNGVMKHEDFPAFLESFLETARKSYQKLLDLEKEVLDSQAVHF